jgi:hypothetical protein
MSDFCFKLIKKIKNFKVIGFLKSFEIEME